MTDNSLVPANEIWYTTIDGECIRWDDIFMVSNTYKEGKGVIVFDEPIVEIGKESFYRILRHIFRKYRLSSVSSHNNLLSETFLPVLFCPLPRKNIPLP